MIKEQKLYTMQHLCINTVAEQNIKKVSCSKSIFGQISTILQIFNTLLSIFVNCKSQVGSNRVTELACNYSRRPIDLSGIVSWRYGLTLSPKSHIISSFTFQAQAHLNVLF